MLLHTKRCVKKRGKFISALLPSLWKRGDGISGIKHSKETREKLRLAHLGKTGRKHSEETKLKMSASQKGKTRKKFSEAHKQKISASLKGKTRKKFSEAHKQKISASLKGNLNALSRGLVFTPLGTFESVKKAATKHTCHVDTIQRRCNNKNLKWKNWYFEKPPLHHDRI